RQYRYAYLEIPKKNSKTTTIAGLAVYHLTCDPPEGQIYCCAADRGQAELVYKAAVSMIEQNEALEEMFKVLDSRKEIVNRHTNTRMKVLSAEAYTKHGINPTVVIFDELHAQPNRNLWDVMTFGAGAARKEPLWWVITTAGDDPDRHSIGWEIHEYARKIRDKELEDPAWYVKIFAAPEDADIFDERTWRMANPSLGITISIESVRQEALAARNSESSQRLFRWLRLNQWVANKTTSWLPLTLWDSMVSELTPADMVGKRCYAGLDLSSTTDLSSVALIFPPQEGLDDYYCFTEQWIPQDNMKIRVHRDKVPYDKWAKDGYIHITPGDVIDYDFIKARLLALNQQYDIAGLGNDPYGAEKLRQDLERDGDLTMMEVRQNIANMSGPAKEIERLLKIGALYHDKNPVTRWAFGNMSIVSDGNENYKPKKTSKISRIDPIVALINATYIMLKLEEGQSRIREVIAI
ncbi:terminase large subunit, partial [bacterium]